MRSRNVCLTQMGADPGRVKDRRMEERGDREKDSPHYRRQNVEREARQREGWAFIPFSGSNGHRTFLRGGRNWNLWKNNNARKRKTTYKGVEKSMGANSKEGGETSCAIISRGGQLGLCEHCSWIGSRGRSPGRSLCCRVAGALRKRFLPSQASAGCTSQTPLLKNEMV